MLSVVVLSFDRSRALLRTLRELAVMGLPGDGGEVIVVDNASRDGSAGAVRERFPRVRLIALDRNTGVAGFNRGVEAASGDTLLILDDDAWPEPGALSAATELLAREPGVGAVSLHPRHPATHASEWPHAREPRSRWPFMGCGLLARAQAWRAVGGYEEAFFLYRNDTDLALKMLAAGYDVRFDPAWVVWHDSSASARKPDRWLRLATRNWVWMTRRHARGWRAPAAALLGVAWASRLAGARPRGQWNVLRGLLAGVARPPPALPPGVRPDGGAMADLLRIRLARRGRPGPVHRPASTPSSVRHSA